MEPRGAERFHAVAAAYARHRPGYPGAAVRRILEVAGLLPPRRDSLVVDIGCGTGISARAFAALGVRVIGIDSNASMLAEARAAGGGTEYREGSAEDTGLPAASVDLLTAAQCFHWLDADRTVAEARRVLRPGGWIAAFWNVRGEAPFRADYERILDRFCPRWGEAKQDLTSLRDLRARPDLRDRVDLDFRHGDRLDLESLLGRVASASYVAHELEDREGFYREVRRAFAAHAVDGRVEWALRVEGSCFRPA